MLRLLFISLICCTTSAVIAQSVDYGYPVHYFPISIETKAVRMAYVDVPAEKSNGRTVLLLHGKNFNAFYWKNVIQHLTAKGFRVIAPDKLGFGQSDKPDIHYSFHLLANNTRSLLDSLGVQKTIVIAHSMGGMLAARFTLLFPSRVEKLILENPIGLEDYRTFVPYRPLDSVIASERGTTYASLKKYQQSYYPVWKDSYEPLVAAQFASYQVPSFEEAAKSSALTYQMIYEQPVVYELDSIRVPTLLIIGQQDRTIVGKNLLSPAVAAAHGQYPALGRKTARRIKGARLVPIAGAGHIPHIQMQEAYLKAVDSFL